jgi:hypothetical protein
VHLLVAPGILPIYWDEVFFYHASLEKWYKETLSLRMACPIEAGNFQIVKRRNNDEELN